MNKLLTTGTVGVATAVAAGLMAFGTPSAFADGDVYLKRYDGADSELTTVDDDADDTEGRGDTNTGSNTNTGTNTNTRTNSRSKDSRDGTNSRHTAVSRDRDHSRGDKTRDWTGDGPGKKKRDWSSNKTNDRSRNDTRG